MEGDDCPDPCDASRQARQPGGPPLVTPRLAGLHMEWDPRNKEKTSKELEQGTIQQE